MGRSSRHRAGHRSRRTHASRRRRGGRPHRQRFDRLAFEPLEPRLVLDAAWPVISEFLADNNGGMVDGDGDDSDWIEIHNPSPDTPVELGGWYLTDDAGDLTQWQFPDVTLPPDGYLIVFASDKYPNGPAGELHTNFALRAAGDYLALVMPDGVSVAHEYWPMFPTQLENVSYGISSTTAISDVLVDENAAVRMLVPGDGALGLSWIGHGFDDSAWLPGEAGVGYEIDSVVTPSYEGLIETDLEAAMYNQQTSVYLRTTFETDQPWLYSSLALRMKYDDGFVAYLNGTEIARRNAPGSLDFDSAATAGHPNAEAVVFEEIDVSAYLSELRFDGPNVLAIHGLNVTADSPDFLIVPELVATVRIAGPERYYSVPTPRAGNDTGAMGFVERPQFSAERGFYEDPFLVTLTTPTPEAEIRYTLDGSTPTATTGDVYAGPISIDTTSALRAAAFRPGYVASDVVTHTYIFVDDVIAQTGAGFPNNWGHAGADYAMDPDVVDDPAYSATIGDDLKDIPSLSLVMDQDDWFAGGGQGIYIQGKGIERAVSVELIDTTGGPEFQVNAAVQIQGGTSTNRWKVDKLSMRVKFKEPYGPTKLEVPLFEDSAVDRFDTFVVDAMMNLSWLHPEEYQRIKAQYVRDQYVADLQNGLGGYGPHGFYVHLYLNGLYWGLYWLHERPDESFAAAYLGGDKDDYDVIKHNSATIVNGTNANYLEMLDVAAAGLASPEQYDLIQQYLDIPDFIDYMLVNFYTGNIDWAHHNWYASRNRVDPNGRWRFYSWDAEHVLRGLNDNVTGLNNAGSPTYLHQKLCANADYRMLFADRVYQQFLGDGLLTPANAAAVYQQRINEVEGAIVGESARWGDNRTPLDPYTRDDEWAAELDWLLDNYFPQRTGIVLQQLRSAGLYPDAEPATLSAPGGEVPRGFEVSMAAPAGTIYYTLNGSDPRLPGGSVSPDALVWSGSPLALVQSVTLKARVLDGGEWSPLAEAEYSIDAASSLVISEFLADNDGGLLDEDGDDSDWIEIHNPAGVPVPLEEGEWYLTDDAADLTKWEIPPITLQPGEYRIVFASGKNRQDPAGELHTNFALDWREGDYLALVRLDADGVPTVVHQYSPQFPPQYENISYGIAENVTTLVGEGAEARYLVPSTADADLGTAWTVPSFDDSAWVGNQAAAPLLITEAATGSPDFLELQNVSGATVDASGWVVAVNNGDGGINGVHDDVLWNLPAVIAPGEILYKTDDNDDHPWAQDYNVRWIVDGSGWAMIVDDRGRVVDFLVWGYTLAEIDSLDVTINGFRITADGAWSGASVPAAGTTTNSVQRTGTSDHDTASDFAFTSPPSKGVQNSGLVLPFADSGAPVTTGIGYNRDAAGFGVTLYKANVGVDSLTAAENVIADPARQDSVAAEIAAVINYENTNAGGHYGANAPFPGTTIGVDVNDFVVEATAAVVIPEAGPWTFGVNSDDGFGLELTKGADTFTSSFPNLRGPNDTLATFDVVQPGVYQLRLVYFEHLGGSCLELFAAQGSYASFDAAAFHLVGDAAGGGLSVTGFGGAIQTDVEADLYDVNSSIWLRVPFQVDDPSTLGGLQLRLKYNDGFVAYLNGQEIARRNAPAEVAWNSAAAAVHPVGQSVVFEEINVTAFLGDLLTGENVLAIHGLNIAAGDADFLLVPELVAVSTQGIERYFATPTPGSANLSGVLDFVADTKFSHDRGFYTDPFWLEITTATPGAAIYYTLDGSTPTDTNGALYESPVWIDRTSIVRARAYKIGFEPTDVDTQTYLFLADLLTQSTDGSPPAGWPAGPVNGQLLDYGMDPDIVDDPEWGPQMLDALTAIPTMSLVTDLDNLFDPAIGIYVNATLRGDEWERPGSLELVNPDGTEGFQVDMGIRIRGGYSRADANPKHAFRFFFREEYGDAKLVYPLFGEEGVDEFDNIDLRTAQNYSWSYHGDPRNLILRDVWSRDLQGEMGQPYTRSRYYHLYINGQYWGLYQTQERAEASYAESYFGGQAEDYDVIKSTGNDAGYTIEATDGAMDAWEDLWNQAKAGFATDEAYYRVQGLNPDGTRNPDYPVLIDVDNLVDYMIVILYSGNRDAPISDFLSNTRPNNWFGIYNRNGEEGFQFFAHDNEHTLLLANLNINRNGPWPAGDELRYSNPQWVHQELMANPDYRMRFADRVQQVFFNDGLLTPQANIDRLLARAAEIDMAIIAESARWGDSKVDPPRTKDDWLATVDDTVANYFSQRSDIVLEQFRNTVLGDGSPAPLYPSVEAPVFNQHGGRVDPGFNLTMDAPSGAIYYTLDGTDPRLPGGAVSPAAHIFTGGTSTVTLVPPGAVWKYLDNGSDQGTAWRALGFADDNWASGEAQLGYGDGDVATVVSYGPDSGNKYITTYFRRKFTVNDASQIVNLTLHLIRDDGAAVYINGHEYRSNMPGGTIDYLTQASVGVGGAEESTWYEIDIDPADLHDGQNIIAVEIHQIRSTSSDISFDLELVAEMTSGDTLSITESAVVKARVLDGGEWSALNEAPFYVGDKAAADNLAITEINYHPYAPTPAELAVNPFLTDEDFEFIELANVSDRLVDLTGVRFVDGVEFDFTGQEIRALAPGERVMIVANPTAFQLRYGSDVAIAGQYGLRLDNGGERITVLGVDDLPIHDFTYDDGGDWPGRSDGKGSALELVDPAGVYSDPDNWRSSVWYGGTPGEENLRPLPDVVVNEVLAAPDPLGMEAIELYNNSPDPVSIGGWVLSDDSDDYRLFEIPAGTVIGGHGYLVFYEDEFNASGQFDLNNAGDEVWLLETGAGGDLLRFADHFKFGRSPADVSYGRWPDGVGDEVLMDEVTLGLPNSGSRPRVGRIVINEIHYDPDVKVEPVEYVELFNAGDVEADLSGWYFSDGIDYTIPAGTILGPGEYLVISEDPDAVLAKFGVASLGPFDKRLANEGETLTLRDAAGLKQDEVDYQRGFPWPTVGDAPGYSIELINPSLDNDLGGSWRASAGTPVVEQTLIEAGSTWRYFKGTEEPSTQPGAWRLDGFADGAWDAGAASIGYGESFVATELADMPGGYTTVYFRKEFTVADLGQITRLYFEAQYDDGLVVWINGEPVLDVNVNAVELPFDATAKGAIENTNFIMFELPPPGDYLVTGTNVIAVQLLNASLDGSSDAFFDARLIGASGGQPGATPGAINSVFAPNAPPQMRQVDHSPNQPQANEAVTITVKVTDRDGVASVTLDYQLVNPGDYISLDDPRFQTEWTTLAMRDDGLGGDELAGDDVYTAVLDPSLQVHRRLVRYRITAEDALGVSVTAPYADDPQPNFAYFVYNGVPVWSGSAQPGVEPEVQYTSELLESVPVYQLITSAESHEDSQFIPDSDRSSGYAGSEYPWLGTLVYDGVVYDHVTFRARGGVWRYAMGKNMWKFDFNRGHYFQAGDNYGQQYDITWDKLNFSAIIQQGDYLHRGEQGLFEAVGYELFNLAGVEAPNTHYIEFRIIDDADEYGSDQYSGDFQGLYLVVEQPDGRMLDEHGLPDGNLYKMEGGTGTLNNQGPTQPTDKSDLNAFMGTYQSTTPSEEWWRDNLDLAEYYSYRAIVEGIHHYDIGYGKNYFYYHNPETGQWSVHPWDIDLTWADNMYGSGHEPFYSRVLTNATFAQEYRNRMREIRDLLYNPEQVGMLIDEIASFVYTAGQPSLVDADRAMWDYNPILASSYVLGGKAGQGRFYQSSPTGDFAGMIQLMKDYVVSRGDWIDTNILTDEALIPDTPAVTYTGEPNFPVDGLTFHTTDFSSAGGNFAALQWRIARYSDLSGPDFDPTQPREYEIQSAWQSGEITTFDDTILIPGEGLEVGETYRVRVRMKDDEGRWSHWSEPVQLVTGAPLGPLPEWLRITEIMYHPSNSTPEEIAAGYADQDSFEYIELVNMGTGPLNLTGVHLQTLEIDYTFGDVGLLPGQHGVLVANQAAFQMRYGDGAKILGEYNPDLATGDLKNSSDDVLLEDPYHRVVHSFTYDDGGAWPGRADGKGSSLEIVDPEGDYTDADNWRSSSEYGGSPGEAGTGPIGDVAINEVLSHTDTPQSDSIELVNLTDQPIDIGGWYLSDFKDEATGTFRKFRIPDGTVLPASVPGGPGGYLVFDEDDFNTSGDPARDFQLDGAEGDEVWLLEADAGDNLVRFVDHVEFQAAINGESFGRWPNGTGDLYPMIDTTLGADNSGPRVGPVIVSEVHFDPGIETNANDLEFIEIHNPTGSAVDLTEWRIRKGVDFDFPDDAEIPASGTILVVPFDPNDPTDNDKLVDFLDHYELDAGIQGRMFGPYDGRLDNGGERVQLQRPDEPPTDRPEIIPRLLEDEVDFEDQSPWAPTGPSDFDSLQRVARDYWGNDAASWLSAAPTPGDVSYPTAVDDTPAPLPEAAPVDIDVLANDSDPEGAIDPTTLFITAEPQHGSLVVNPITGMVTYTPEPGFNGSDSFGYRVLDDGGFATNEATVTVSVVPTNNAPVVVNPIADVQAYEDDGSRFIQLSSVFYDADVATDDDVLTLSLAGNANPSLVAATVFGKSLWLSLRTNQNGSAEITVRATDLAGAWAEDTFTLTVVPLNDAPAVVDPVADVEVDQGAADTIVQFGGVFDDPDIATNGDTLALTVAGNTNPDLVQTTWNGTALTLSFAPDQNGIAELTVRATDLAGVWAEDTLTVTVLPNVDLDVDANGTADALTDGVIILRYLFGFTGESLIGGGLAPDATRTEPDDIAEFLDAGRPTMLDVDLSGTADALTDGIVILRYLFGFTGQALIESALAPNAGRTDPADLIAFLDEFNPAVQGSSAAAFAPLADTTAQTQPAADSALAAQPQPLAAAPKLMPGALERTDRIPLLHGPQSTAQSPRTPADGHAAPLDAKRVDTVWSAPADETPANDWLDASRSHLPTLYRAMALDRIQSRANAGRHQMPAIGEVDLLMLLQDRPDF